LALGLGISLDGLALGFTYGVLKLPVVLTTVVIMTQAVVATQLGFALGAKVKPAWRHHGELLAGWALVVIGAVILVQILQA
jgi:putative Mn2+ efflux pump MntP